MFDIDRRDWISGTKCSIIRPSWIQQRLPYKLQKRFTAQNKKEKAGRTYNYPIRGRSIHTHTQDSLTRHEQQVSRAWSLRLLLPRNNVLLVFTQRHRARARTYDPTRHTIKNGIQGSYSRMNDDTRGLESTRPRQNNSLHHHNHRLNMSNSYFTARVPASLRVLHVNTRHPPPPENEKPEIDSSIDRATLARPSRFLPAYCSTTLPAPPHHTPTKEKERGRQDAGKMRRPIFHQSEPMRGFAGQERTCLSCRKRRRSSLRAADRSPSPRVTSLPFPLRGFSWVQRCTCSEGKFLHISPPSPTDST